MAFYEDRIFPYVMEWGTKPFRRSCQQALSHAHGKVLEVGVGTGANMSYYTPAVTDVVGIEPVDAMLSKARARLEETPPPFVWQLQRADARELPFEDASFDSVVAVLVFCTIPNPERAAAEAFRVLKPGGKLVFFEHVVARHAGVARWQHRLNPVWRKMACGCEINRDTRRLFEQVGFQLEKLREWNHEKALGLVAPVISGVGVRP